MTWLDGIEADAKRMLDLDVIEPYHSYHLERKRMARVIRELAAALWKLQVDRNANVFDDLSEDANEMV